MMNRSPYITPIFRIESIFSNKKALWDEMNAVVHKKHLGFNQFMWSDKTFITVEAWRRIFAQNLEPKLATDFSLDLNLQNNVNAILSSLMTLCPWRYSQNCYHLNEHIYDQTFNNKSAAVISPKHFENMTEFSTCIPLIDAKIDNRVVHNIYAHKTYLDTWSNEDQVPNCLILTFNIDPEPNDLRLIHKDRDFKPMPYVVLQANKHQSIESSIIEFGAFPITFHSADEFLQFISPYIALFNVIFDPQTSIESEYVGIRKPRYTDIQSNINFNDLNFPTIKHLAPSNARMWQVAHNLYAKLKQRQRKENLESLPLLIWKDTGSELQLIS